MNVLLQKTWSPYVAGALAGLLLVLSVFLTGKYMGASTTFVRAAGFVEQAVAPEKIAGMEYFVKTKAKVDWQFMFVIGVLFGSLASVSLSKEMRAVPVPPHVVAPFRPVPGEALGSWFSGRYSRHVRSAPRRWVTERTRTERSGSDSSQRLRLTDMFFPGWCHHSQNSVWR